MKVGDLVKSSYSSNSSWNDPKEFDIGIIIEEDVVFFGDGDCEQSADEIYWDYAVLYSDGVIEGADEEYLELFNEDR